MRHECGNEFELIHRRSKIRRGGRVVPYDSVFYRCPICTEYDEPVDVITEELRKQNKLAAEAAWREATGEALPPRGRPGRKSERPKTKLIAFRISEEELEILEEIREKNGTSIAEVLRRMIGAARNKPVPMTQKVLSDLPEDLKKIVVEAREEAADLEKRAARFEQLVADFERSLAV